MQFRFFGHLILLSTALLVKSQDTSGESPSDLYSSFESQELDQSIEAPILPNSLSISKDWAIKFDNDLGRGESMTDSKRIELDNNLIEMAELLHIIPERTDSKPREIPVPPSASSQVADHNQNRVEFVNPKFGMYTKKMQ